MVEFLGKFEGQGIKIALIQFNLILDGVGVSVVIEVIFRA